MTYELAPRVESDLEAIGDYIALHNRTRALSFVQEIRRHFDVIAQNPESYRLREELGRDIRIAPHGRYLIVFRILEELVRVDRVVSGYRDGAGQGPV